jgi:hypothetical protein
MQVTQMTWWCSQTTERGDKLLCTSDCWKRGIASAVDNIGAYKFSFSQLKMLSGVWIVALNISECLPLYFRLDFVHEKIYRGLLVDMACKKLYVLVVGMLLWRRKKERRKTAISIRACTSRLEVRAHNQGRNNWWIQWGRQTWDLKRQGSGDIHVLTEGQSLWV